MFPVSVHKHPVIGEREKEKEMKNVAGIIVDYTRLFMVESKRMLLLSIFQISKL